MKGEKRTITLENGKYSVTVEHSLEGFLFYAKRDDQHWRDLIGDKLILAMFEEITTLRNQLGLDTSGKEEQEFHVAFWVSEKMLSGITVSAPDLVTAILGVCTFKNVKPEAIVYAHAKSSVYK